MLDANKLKADILSDMRVELSDEFDRNFERKAFSPTSGSLAPMITIVARCS